MYQNMYIIEEIHFFRPREALFLQKWIFFLCGRMTGRTQNAKRWRVTDLRQQLASSGLVATEHGTRQPAV
jgi:hypothetical protein